MIVMNGLQQTDLKRQVPNRFDYQMMQISYSTIYSDDDFTR